MNPELRQAWWPLALASQLDGQGPLARRLHGVPIVLFRDARRAAVALQDRCPHRHAPLSAGKVQEGELRCAYHGWRFGAHGRCLEVPGLAVLPEPCPAVPTVAVCEIHGLLWACLGNPDKAPAPQAPGVLEGVDSFFMVDRVRCGLAEAAENFLDGFHTHYVHAGWIRRAAARREIRAEVRRLDRGIAVSYFDEGLQSGAISRWLEGDRTQSTGRFRWPGVAEIEYQGTHGLNLLVTAWLTPEDGEHVRVHARVATRRGRVPAWLKHAALRALFGMILRQDKRIVEQASANARAFAAAGLPRGELSTPLDLLGPAIRRLLAGQALDDSMERSHRLLL